MKSARYLSFLLCGSLIFSACKKDEGNADPEEFNHSITGHWELYESTGGMSPHTTYPPGNGNRIHFDSSDYKYYVNGQLMKQGTYYVFNDSVVDLNSCELKPPPSAIANRIVYDMELNSRISFEISSGKLKIMSGCLPLDGGSSVYKRIEGGF